MSSSTKLLREYIRTVKQTKSRRKLWVFDFDDTLVKTDCCTHVTTAAGEKFDLTPGQLVTYEKQPGDTFDYTDFEKLINPRPIKWMNHILHNVIAHHGKDAVVVLSARSYHEPIRQYLASVGINDIEIVALNTAAPDAKSSWIAERVRRDGYQCVEFFDDSHKNVNAVADLRHRLPHVAIFSRHVVHNRISYSLFDGHRDLVIEEGR